MDIKEHFNKQTNTITFPPPKNIKYCVYSDKIWHSFTQKLNYNDKIIDIGCGGGTALYCLEALGFTNTYGIDFCHSIPSNFLKHSTFIEGDFTDSNLDSNGFDAAVSTHVIEHLNEERFVSELFRILKKNGIALVTSVLKGKYSWYFYKNSNGERVIEPSHLKEYKSMEEYKNVFNSKFEIIDIQKSALTYSVIDPFFRALLRITKLNYFRELPTRNYIFSMLRNIRITIPFYYSIEVILKK